MLETDHVRHGYPSRLGPARGNSFENDISPSISIISSFLPPRIPPEPRIPLSFLGEENLQVSDASTTDLDMRWCVFGLPDSIDPKLIQRR